MQTPTPVNDPQTTALLAQWANWQAKRVRFAEPGFWALQRQAFGGLFKTLRVRAGLTAAPKA
jgi:hypothetical protein